MSTEIRNRDDIVLVHPGDVTIVDELDARQRRERTVAKLRLLWERRRLLGKCVLFSLAFFMIIALIIPARYESTVRLMPPDQGSGGMLGALTAITGSTGGSDPTAGLGSLAGLAGSVLGLKTSSDLFVGLLQSRTIEDHLINKFNLRKVYWDRRMEDARKDLAKRTDISADRKSGIITIAVTDHDPRRAAAMAGEYVSELDTVLVSLNTSAAHRERVFLEERLKQVEKDLEQAEKSLGTFSSKNATLDMKEQSIAMVDTAAMLEGQLVAAQTELQGLRQVYSDSNVRVRTLQARISELRRQIAKMGGKPQTAGTESIGISKNDDERYVDSLYPTIRALPMLGTQYADLYRETKVQEATFGMLTREYELAKVNEVKELPSVRVLDQPEVPGKRSFPPRMVIVLLGAVLGIICGAGIIFASDGWRAIDPQDPAKILASDVWIQFKERSSARDDGVHKSDFKGEGTKQIDAARK